MAFDQQNTFFINSQKLSKNILIYFILIELSFLLLDITVNFNRAIDYPSIRRLFNLAREDSLAAWFMNSQTLLTALVLWFIYFIVHNCKNKTALEKNSWLFFAVFFTYLAMDDGSMIHERVGSAIKVILKNDTFDYKIPSYTWQFVFLPFFIPVGLYIMWFFWKTFRNSLEIIYIILALLLLTAAVVLDYYEGLDKHSTSNVYSFLKEMLGIKTATVRHFSRAVEELMEMIGMSLFLSAFIRHLHKVSSNITIRFT